jgi:hypothetical protein
MKNSNKRSIHTIIAITFWTRRYQRSGIRQTAERTQAYRSGPSRLVTPDSPTQRAGAKPADRFVKVQHPAPILSLANAFGADDTRTWFERISRIDDRVEKGRSLWSNRRSMAYPSFCIIGMESLCKAQRAEMEK